MSQPSAAGESTKGGSKQPPAIVAVGSSAGGLEALKELFTDMSPDIKAAFVVVQHLGSSFASNLDKLLSKVTELKIVIATSGQALEAGYIYLQPKGSTIVLKDDCITLKPIHRATTLQFPINGLFDSLAKVQHRPLIGIVLSGTGSDGARALPTLQAAGGLIIAQSPESAEFTGMPQTAIDTHTVDYVMAPDVMGKAINSFIEFGERRGAQRPSSENVALNMLFSLLLDQTGIDFKLYKQTTLLRRIERRMGICHVLSVDRYLERVTKDRDELEWLTRDLLIGVTAFFRDPAAFESLTEIVKQRLKNEWANRDVIRCWVTCCSTGQEAYTVAMVLLEAMESLGINKPIKVFATDAEASAVAKTSLGMYTEAEISEIPLDIKEKYFHPANNGWCVNTQVRERVVAATHNLLKDPPFSNLDLVTCRNMMIYLMHEAQRRVMTALHFSMSKNGVMMLGRSENLRDLEHCFECLDEKAKIYTNLDVGRMPLDTVVIPKPTKNVRATPMIMPRDTDENRLIREMALELLGEFTPPSIVVDDQERIRHVFGDISQFTQPLKPGRFSPSMSNMVHEDLSVAVFTALKRSKEENKEINYRNVTLKSREGSVHLRVLPFTDKATGQRLFLTVFESADQPSSLPSDGSINFDEIEQARERIGHLESEVQRQSENLLITVEELETTNEELQASNEELTVANEELQSTNEELQSVNEELYSVNAEYEEKIRELSDVNVLLDQIMSSTAIGILMLDENKQVRSFTASVCQFVRLIDSDVGRPLSDISHNLDYPEMMADVEKVLKTASSLSCVVHSNDKPVLIRVNPYGDQAEAGVVITFTPISSTTDIPSSVNR